MTFGEYKELTAVEEDGVLTVTFNRPKRKNAMNPTLYIDFLTVLRDARLSETVRVVVLTGAGDYYSSGNDLSNFMSVDMSDQDAIKKLMKDSKEMLVQLIEELVIFPKILIALVNGPAIGVGCTHLALCDFVYTLDSYVSYLFGARVGHFKSRTYLSFLPALHDHCHRVAHLT
jgi:peroxisomal 3,2-trans-enoyl-CoA isomerase